MQAPLRKKTLELFRKKMKAQLPLFDLVSKGRESPMWSLSVDPSLTFFILLSISHDYDKFYVEFAWSDEGEFPWKGVTEPGQTGRSLFSSDITVEAPQCRERLPLLWTKHDIAWSVVPELSGEERTRKILESDDDDFTWIEPDLPVQEALKRVPALVDDAVSKVAEYAIPLFKKVMEHHRLEWPSA